MKRFRHRVIHGGHGRFWSVCNSYFHGELCKVWDGDENVSKLKESL